MKITKIEAIAAEPQTTYHQVELIRHHRELQRETCIVLACPDIGGCLLGKDYLTAPDTEQPLTALPAPPWLKPTESDNSFISPYIRASEEALNHYYDKRSELALAHGLGTIPLTLSLSQLYEYKRKGNIVVHRLDDCTLGVTCLTNDIQYQLQLSEQEQLPMSSLSDNESSMVNKVLTALLTQGDTGKVSISTNKLLKKIHYAVNDDRNQPILVLAIYHQQQLLPVFI